MAKIFELSKNISPVIVRIQQANVVRERMMSAYQKRAGEVCKDTHIFEQCKQARPQRGKYHNTLFREQSGTIGTTIVTKHTASGRTIVCRTKNY